MGPGALPKFERVRRKAQVLREARAGGCVCPRRSGHGLLPQDLAALPQLPHAYVVLQHAHHFVPRRVVRRGAEVGRVVLRRYEHEGVRAVRDVDGPGAGEGPQHERGRAPGPCGPCPGPPAPPSRGGSRGAGGRRWAAARKGGGGGVRRVMVCLLSSYTNPQLKPPAQCAPAARCTHTRAPPPLCVFQFQLKPPARGITRACCRAAEGMWGESLCVFLP